MRSLRGRVMAAELGCPSAIAVVGPNVVVLDDASDSVVHVVRAADGALLRSFGRRGEGPGEYRSAWSLATTPGGGRGVWIYDMALQRFTAVRDVEDPSGPIHSISLRTDGPATTPLWLTDSMIVTPGFFSGGRLARLEPGGMVRGYVGALPPGGAEIPPSVRQHAYTGSLAKSEARSLLALATRHADQIEIYRPDGTLVRRARGPFGFEPRFTVSTRGGKPAMTTDDGLRFGYIDVTATDEWIFALFSGRTREGSGGDAAFGRYVHVFDWDGTLREVLRLDADLLTLAVARDGRTLYGVRHDPEPAVVAYRLD
ncbi:MAG TPA: BF3164 family lipoprotein [Longimicrobium sp.]|nr:BF3164 family lipoprotein [Longimicrobium sp.]